MANDDTARDPETRQWFRPLFEAIAWLWLRVILTPVITLPSVVFAILNWPTFYEDVMLGINLLPEDVTAVYEQYNTNLVEKYPSTYP